MCTVIVFEQICVCRYVGVVPVLSRLALWIPGFASCVVWQYTREKNLSIQTKFSCASIGTQQPKALDARESVIACRNLTIQRQLRARPIEVVAVSERTLLRS